MSEGLRVKLDASPDASPARKRLSLGAITPVFEGRNGLPAFDPRSVESHPAGVWTRRIEILPFLAHPGALSISNGCGPPVSSKPRFHQETWPSRSHTRQEPPSSGVRQFGRPAQLASRHGSSRQRLSRAWHWAEHSPHRTDLPWQATASNLCRY